MAINKLILGLVGALALIGAGLGAGLAMSRMGQGASPLTIKIGVAQPLTGNLAALGQDLLNGVNMAAAEINQTGFQVNGRPATLEVVAVDDRSDAATGKEVAQSLVDAGVVAVIGHLNSGVSIAAAPIYAQHHIAELAISTNPKFTALGLDTTFRLVANDTLQAKAMGSYAITQFPIGRYAVIDDGTPYGKDLAAGATRELEAGNKNVIISQSFDDKTTQFDDLAQRIKQSKVEGIISTLNDFQLISLLQSLKRLDYTEVHVLGGDTIKTPLMLQGAPFVRWLYATSPIAQTREFTAGGAFLAKYKDKFHLEPSYAGHYTYDAMHVLAAAITRCNCTQSKKIAEELRKIDGYAPVTGSMKWDARGEQRYGAIGVYRATPELWEPQMRSDTW